jgi:hypothetical protein
VLREKYERQVSERLGISLDAFRAKKVKKEEKKLKKTNVVNNTTVISRAEKNLAAIAAFSKADLGDFEVMKFNKDELSLIFEEQYGKFTAPELQKEANNLIKKALAERRGAEQKELEEQIRIAEEKGDDAQIEELMKKLSELLRKK